MQHSHRTAARAARHHDGGAPESSEARRPAPPNPPTDGTGQDSWHSNLWFGLGTLAPFLLFLVPGVPRHGLLIGYFFAGAFVMLGIGAWGVVHSMANALRSRRARRGARTG